MKTTRKTAAATRQREKTEALAKAGRRRQSETLLSVDDWKIFCFSLYSIYFSYLIHIFSKKKSNPDKSMYRMMLVSTWGFAEHLRSGRSLESIGRRVPILSSRCVASSISAHEKHKANQHINAPRTLQPSTLLLLVPFHALTHHKVRNL